MFLRHDDENTWTEKIIIFCMCLFLLLGLSCGVIALIYKDILLCIISFSFFVCAFLLKSEGKITFFSKNKK